MEIKQDINNPVIDYKSQRIRSKSNDSKGLIHPEELILYSSNDTMFLVLEGLKRTWLEKIHCSYKQASNKLKSKLEPKLSTAKPFTINGLKQLPERAGCYALLNEQNNVLYVGQSLNIRKRSRTAGHLRALGDYNDKWKVCYWLDSNQKGLEYYLINYLAPIHNTQGRGNYLPAYCRWRG